MLTALGLKRKITTPVVNAADAEARERALNSINGTWKRPESNDEYHSTKYSASEMPTKVQGGQINLIRAIVDESDDLIKADRAELEELKRRQEFLNNRIAAYEELLEVGKKHFTKMTVTVTTK